jgi:DNA-binding transcriptional LysR family regulator
MHSLELSLGEKLVDRRPDGYVLTPAGTRALASASEMEAAAEVFSRGGTDDSPKGLVRVNAPPSLAQVFLAPRLAELTIRHEGLDIDLAADVRTVSLERRETDIALRFGRPSDGDVIARKVAILGFGFYATPELIERTKAGVAPIFVGFDELNAYLPEAQWLARSYPRARIAFRASNQLSHASAATAGAGIALLPHFVGRSTPGLEACVLNQTPPFREIWMVTRRLDRKDLSIRTVAEGLVQIFWDEHGLFDSGALEQRVDRLQPTEII